MVLNHDLEDLVRGDSFRLPLTFVEGDPPVAKDITGWTISFTLKRDPGVSDSNAAVAIDVTDHYNAAAGETIISMAPAVTNALSDRYQYDIQITMPGSPPHVETILMGNISIIEDVTRRS